MFYKHKLSAKKNCVSKEYLCAIILKKGNDMGKIIVVEGTDCSGKETQTKRLVQNLLDMGIKAIRMAFPMYDTPTGKIIGGAFLGKEQFDIKPVFEETSVNVPAKVASLFYAADRCYNKDKIQKYLDDGYVVVLDRYVESNMAFQGCKMPPEKRQEFFEFVQKLEYDLLDIPKPDLRILLYMPIWASKILKKGRDEKPDQNERNEEYLSAAEETYLLLAKLFDFKIIDCVQGDKIKTVDQIQSQVFDCVKNYLQNQKI